MKGSLQLKVPDQNEELPRVASGLDAGALLGIEFNFALLLCLSHKRNFFPFFTQEKVIKYSFYTSFYINAQICGFIFDLHNFEFHKVRPTQFTH